ncbi:hypothetical protein G3436_21640, partial [Pseudomonas sp. MAFF212427]|nr:hypothetical protein [Pseudomonas brassicae]
MSHADDIGNLFHRFGASADSYKEIDTEFEFIEPLLTTAEPEVPAIAVAGAPVAATLAALKLPPTVAAVPVAAPALVAVPTQASPAPHTLPNRRPPCRCASNSRRLRACAAQAQG